MQYLSILIGLCILGFVGYKLVKQPGSLSTGQVIAEAPPPPPPQIEELPPPVLDPEALEKVRLATRDSDSQVRWEAIQLLAETRDPKAEAMMYSMLQRDSEASIRLNVVGLVEKHEGAKAVPHLIRALRDTEADVRLAALGSLGRLGDHSATPAITEAIRDMDERVRLEAIRTLKTLETSRAQQIETARRAHEEKMRVWEEEVRRREEQQQRARKD